jgi:pyridoxine 4-dehydrogenase
MTVRGEVMWQVAINWCLCQGTIPIPGAKSVKQVEEALGALGWRMSTSECQALETAADAAPRVMLQNIFQTN